MVTLLLAAAIATQQAQVSARVNRVEVVVGEELLLTIVARTVGEEPTEIVNPNLTRLALTGTREQSRVRVRGGSPVRETTRELTLRAVAAGTAVIGSVVVRHGGAVAQSTPIRVTVTVPDAGVVGLAPHVRALLGEIAPPRLARDDVGLSVYPSPGVVVLGEQVDLVVVAWFPRDIRARLRNPPTLSPPPVRGAWSYRRATPIRPALSRRVRGVWYDLYVLHDVVFPVTAGTLEIGSATVSYSVPLSYSFLSREQRHEVQSEPVAVTVRAQPTAGRPSGFSGAAGRNLRLTVETSGRELPLGGGATVRAELRGVGNLALWPEPAFAWPPGLRVYPEGVEERLETVDGFVGGVKVFHYLVVADSVGAHRVPAPAYPYFDVRRGRYMTLEGAPVEFVATGTSASAGLAGTVPPLMPARARPAVDVAASRMPRWGWLVLALSPVLVAVAIRTARRRRGARGSPSTRRVRAGGELVQLEGDVRQLLEGLVPDAASRDGGALAHALRAAGIDEPVAGHAARVWARLQQAIYGPDGASDPVELAAEARAMLEALGPQLRPSPRWAAILAAAFLVAGAPPLTGQTPDRLYETGAVRLAADSFAARAAGAPGVAEHWYNLGAARYRLGDRSGARTAWLRAGRLRPRNPLVRRGLGLVPPPDRGSARLTWIAPVTPLEAAALALILWIGGWVAVAAGRRARAGLVIAGVSLAVGAYAAYVTYRYREPVALAAEADTPLRAAPYGSAPAASRLEEGTAVLVSRRRGPWLLVRRGSERGWLLTSEVERL